MVSKILTSLDAWLALADEVLAEQHELSERHSWAEAAEPADQLSLLPLEAAPVVSGIGPRGAIRIERDTTELV